MDLLWGKSVASTDGWMGTLVGSVIRRDSTQVTHLVVKRGLLFAKRYAIPLHRLFRWDVEGLYLDGSILDLSKDPISRSDNGDLAEVTLTNRTRVVVSGAAQPRLKGLRLTEDDHKIRQLIVGNQGYNKPSLFLPIDAVAEFGSGQITTSIDRTALESAPHYRADHEIENDLREALLLSNNFTERDVKGIKVSVADNRVELSGNVNDPSSVDEATRLARSVTGVVMVTNKLVSDWDIELAIASYISREVPELADSIFVRAQIGTVYMEGHVPSTDLSEKAISGIQSISGVRNIQNQIQVLPPAPPEEPPETEDSSSEEEPAEPENDETIDRQTSESEGSPTDAASESG